MTNGVYEFSYINFVHAMKSLCLASSYYTTLDIAQQIEVRYNCASGAVAHRLEQAAHNHLVDGSIPSSPTRLDYSTARNSLAVCYYKYKDTTGIAVSTKK